MSGVRTYEAKACPVHGIEHMRNGNCRALVEKTATHNRYCHMEETVTAIDARDVEGLLLALLRELVPAGATKYLPDNPTTRELLHNLEHAAEPFVSSTQQGESGG